MDPYGRSIDGGVRTIGVAVPIPEPWGSQLDARRAATGDPQAGLIPSHLTLLGPTDLAEERLPNVDKHLSQVAAGHRSFTLHLRGTGTFRPVSDVVFIAVVAGISECEQLEREIRTGPLRRELRFPYHPHVTVAHDVDGRIGQDRLDVVFNELARFEARFPVSMFTLFEHGPDGRWRPQRDFLLTQL
ncbi:MAG TPA: 2'-5' RNA ligase family protein [Micromonosporaceae bacterium]|nr:2'-5' RNA ligase family protein [Micromonosporaceae bacterium]